MPEQEQVVYSSQDTHSLADASLQSTAYAPAELLQIILQTALDALGYSLNKEFHRGHRQQILNISTQHAPQSPCCFKQVRHVGSVTYSSAIAHQLVTVTPGTPAAIADQISHAMVDQAIVAKIMLAKTTMAKVDSLPLHQLPSQVLQGLTVQATASGYLQCQFNDSAIAYWLNILIDSCPLPPVPCSRPPAPCPLPPVPLFSLQHAHARCCSLLRLAHDTHLIQLAKLEGHPNQWQFVTPQPMPWLTSNQQLQMHHPAEKALIGHLLHSLDQRRLRSPQPPKQAFRLAEELAKTLQQVHQNCQLWGDSHTRTLDQRHAYLGLILATQRGLNFQLQHQLGIYAPTEL